MQGLVGEFPTPVSQAAGFFQELFVVAGSLQQPFPDLGLLFVPLFRPSQLAPPPAKAIMQPARGEAPVPTSLFNSYC